MTAQPVTPLPTGIDLGDEFHIERTLGRGGFGITYLIRALKDVDERVRKGQKFVVKEFAMAECVRRCHDGIRLEPVGETDEARNIFWNFFSKELAKFDREARTLAAFRHSHIVEVLLIRRANGTAYMIMEFVDGEPLSAQIMKACRARGYGLSWPELEPIAADMLDALEYIHDRRVIHRDIKPDNIMLRSGGEAVLIDFGGARASTSARTSMVFTPGHAGAEQIYNFQLGKDTPENRLADVNPATDVYGMAATFYHAMTGEAPYAIDGELRVVQHRHPLTGHPLQTQLQLPDKIARAIDSALNFNDARARPQTVTQWRKAFPARTRLHGKLGKNGRSDPAPKTAPADLYEKAEQLRLNGREDRDIRQMVDLYRQSSDAGHVPALYRLGRIYQDGDLVPQDFSLARRYFEKAAGAGDNMSCFRLAEIFMQGRGTKNELRQAYKMALRAAEGGLAPAANLVGRFHRKGIHVPQNDTLACDWYEKAMRGGSADAAHNLAAMYQRGLGRPQDERLARRLEDAERRLRCGESTRDVLKDDPINFNAQEEG